MEACLTAEGTGDTGVHQVGPPALSSGVLRVQAFGVLEGVVGLQLQRAAGAPRFGVVRNDCPRFTYGTAQSMRPLII